MDKARAEEENKNKAGEEEEKRRRGKLRLLAEFGVLIGHTSLD